MSVFLSQHPCERSKRSIKCCSFPITLLWTHQSVRCKCLSFFQNIPVNTYKSVMEVSIIFLNLVVNRSNKCDASFVYFLTTWLLTYQKVWFKIQYFWQNYCEHVKRCDIFFAFYCFLLFVFFTTLLWTQQNVGFKCLSFFTTFL